MNKIIGSGDFDLDGDADLLSREAATGTLWLSPFYGASGDGFAPRRKVGTVWNVFTQLSSPEIIGGSPVVHRRQPGRRAAPVPRGRHTAGSTPTRCTGVGTGWQTYMVAP